MGMPPAASTSLLLQDDALAADFREARGIAHGRARAALRQGLDDLDGRQARRAEEGRVGRLRQVGGAAIGAVRPAISVLSGWIGQIGPA